MDLASFIDFDLIDANGYQLITELNLDKSEFLTCFEQSNFKIYYSERMESHYHEFQTLPFSENLSESADVGGFHTDFSWNDSPPRYIALMCIEEDSKYPYFGFNQVVKSIDLFNALTQIFELNEQEIYELKVPYIIGNSTWKPIFIPSSDGKPTVKYHESYVDTELANKQLIHDIPINYIIRHLCNQFSSVIHNRVRNILIVDNHKALHKRAEATVCFKDKNSFESRKLITVRFDR